jgi:hypothetical protein
MKCLLSLLFLFLCVASVAGQRNIEGYLVKHEDAKQLVQQLLRSPEKKDQAWAAWLVGKYRLEEFAPALTELLPAQTPAWASDDDWLARAIFDALVQLDAEVAAARLIPLFDQYSNVVVILLAKSSEKHQHELFSLLEKNLLDEHWLAICNLLAKQRSPGFAAILLRDLSIQATLHVTQDPNAGYGGGASSFGRGCGVAKAPKGFPPPVRYELSTRHQRGNVLVVPGRHPVYYSRVEAKPDERGQFGVGSSHNYGDRNEYRADYLLDLLYASRETSSFTHNPSFTIVWKNSVAYQREIARTRKQLNQSWHAMVERLMQANLLTTEEAATLKPNISLQVFDHRENQTEKLPDP